MLTYEECGIEILTAMFETSSEHGHLRKWAKKNAAAVVSKFNLVLLNMAMHYLIYCNYLKKMLTFHCYVSFIHRLCFPILSRIRCGSGCGKPVFFCTMEIHGDPWSAEESLGYKYDSESPGFYEVAETTSHGDPGLVAFVEGVIEVRFEFDHPVVNSTMIWRY